MINIEVKTPAEREMLDFARSQLRFSELDLKTHCFAKEPVRLRFINRMKEEGVFTPCGGTGFRAQYTTWGPREAEAIQNLAETEGLEGKGAKELFARLAEAAKACGIAVDKPLFNPRTPEERKIWTFVSSRPYFRSSEVYEAFNLDPVSTMGFLRSLKAAKVVRFWGYNNGEKFYTVHDPKLGRNTSKDLRSTLEGAIWTAIRIKKRFRASDIFFALRPTRPEIKQAEINKYCRVLQEAGYLRSPKPVKQLRSETPLILVNNSGPLPPKSSRVTVTIDPNLGKIVRAPEGIEQ